MSFLSCNSFGLEVYFSDISIDTLDLFGLLFGQKVFFSFVCFQDGLHWWLRWERIHLQCSDGKESTCNGLIPGLGRSPGGGHDNPLQYSYLKNPHRQRSMADYSPWGRKDSDMTERLSIAHFQDIYAFGSLVDNIQIHISHEIWEVFGHYLFIYSVFPFLLLLGLT